jgi:hypothetical protein
MTTRLMSLVLLRSPAICRVGEFIYFTRREACNSGGIPGETMESAVSTDAARP